MKSVFISILLFELVIDAVAQIDFIQCINSINWQGTEYELVQTLSDNIIETYHKEWIEENTSSDYSLTNISFGQFVITNASIRVNKTNKKLFRINFVVFDEITDDALIHNADKLLTNSLGSYVSKSEYEGMSSFYKKEWLSKECLVRSTLIIDSEHRYSLVLSVEPIDKYYVDYKNVTIELNEREIPIPLVESFVLDNEKNVYIQMEGGIILKKEKTKKMNTPKGEIIVFDGGMFCYRKEDNDIVYIKEKFLACYPIVSKTN